MDACFSAHDMQKYQYLHFLSFKWLWLRWCLFLIDFFFLHPLTLSLFLSPFLCSLRCLFFYVYMPLKWFRYNWKDQTVAYTTDAIFILIFVLGLIFHAHQTEATYRLDFIWKLQATGKIENKFLQWILCKLLLACHRHSS